MKPLVYILSAILLVFISVNFNSETGPKRTGNSLASLGAFSCSKPVPENKRVTGWPEEQYYIGINSFIDHLRGNLYTLGSLTPRQMGRKDEKKNPGDYLDGPSLVNPRPEQHKPDSISIDKLESYIADMLRPEYASDGIISLIADYDDVWGDTARDEFFGRFILYGQKMSIGGWYGKFAVLGLYLPYDDVEGLLSEARKFINIPDIEVDSIRVSQRDTTYFYEYLPRDGGFRIRGFPVTFISQENRKSTVKTMVIEFTKYYDEEFVP